MKKWNGWVPLWAGLTMGQLEAEVGVRKLEEGLRLEKDAGSSTTLLVTKPDWDAKGWIIGKVRKVKRRMW